jgi:IS5 family transposase
MPKPAAARRREGNPADLQDALDQRKRFLLVSSLNRYHVRSYSAESVAFNKAIHRGACWNHIFSTFKILCALTLQYPGRQEQLIGT